LELARPAIIIVENNIDATIDVDAMADATPQVNNMDIALSELGSRGYECQQMSGDASSYGTPEKRWLHYIVGVLGVANLHLDFLDRSVIDTFRTLRCLINVCQRVPPCLSQVLYRANDSRVVTSLEEKRSPSTVADRKRCFSVETSIKNAVLSGVAWSAIKPPDWLKSSPWFQVLPASSKQAAAISFCMDSSTVLLRDVSRASATDIGVWHQVGAKMRTRLSSRSDTGNHLSFPMALGQVVFVSNGLEQPRLLLEEEAMILQGFPIAKVADLVKETPWAELADIGAHMISVPMVLVLLMSSIASVHWRDVDVGDASPEHAVADDASNIGSALFAFGLLANGGRDKPDDGPTPKKIKF